MITADRNMKGNCGHENCKVGVEVEKLSCLDFHGSESQHRAFLSPNWCCTRLRRPQINEPGGPKFTQEAQNQLGRHWWARPTLEGSAEASDRSQVVTAPVCSAFESARSRFLESSMEKG